MDGVEEFSNRTIEPTALPSVPEELFESLHPNYLRLRLAGDAIFAAVVVVAGAVLSFIVPVWWIPLVVAAAILALTAVAAWLHSVEVDHIGYLVREQDFSFRQGVISRSVKTVPFARVQHVSIDRGPLARRFGLATLEMQTAGDGLTVPGIDGTTAERLKAVVVDRAGVAADEELTGSAGFTTAADTTITNTATPPTMAPPTTAPIMPPPTAPTSPTAPIMPPPTAGFGDD